MALTPGRYALKYATSDTVLAHLSRLTKAFSEMDPDFVTQLKNRLQTRRRPTVYCEFPVDTLTLEELWRVMGLHGYFLKRTTTAQGLDMVWYDFEIKSFLFWGPNNRSVVRGINAIRWRVFKQTAPAQAQASLGSASLGSASLGSASLGSASLGSASLGSASLGSADMWPASVWPTADILANDLACDLACDLANDLANDLEANDLANDLASDLASDLANDLASDLEANDLANDLASDLASDLACALVQD